MSEENIAIFLDFENLALSAEEAYPKKDRPLEIASIVDFAATKGTICIKKAYADWSNSLFSQYQIKLINKGFELIHLPATNQQGKNGSDVKLAVDVMEHMAVFNTVDTIIIGSGDSDFVPLIHLIKARGKKVIVLGFDHSVGRLVKSNSNEFRSLEDLIGSPDEESVPFDHSNFKDINEARELLVRYMNNMEDISKPVLPSQFKHDLLKLDPSFSENRFGYKSFMKFVEEFDGDLVEKIYSSGKGQEEIFFNEAYRSKGVKKEPKKEAKILLNKVKFATTKTDRLKITTIIFNAFKEGREPSMNELADMVTGGFP
ncbi:MAG: NYN domain-containing protein, partial [Candidatus Thermoplasmatota archaeon]|nr:NYN domain-containing protein [Candidatus Thermoplasmatota archaeon]